jgi:hypothetical protein
MLTIRLPILAAVSPPTVFWGTLREVHRRPLSETPGRNSMVYAANFRELSTNQNDCVYSCYWLPNSFQ